MVKLGDVATVITGSTPKKEPGNYGGEIPFVTPGDLGEFAEIVVSSNTLTLQGAKQARVLPKGAVLVCCIGATIGKVGIAGRNLVTNQQINSLVFDENKVLPKFAYYYALTMKPALLAGSSSTTMPIINKSNFSKLEMPLPPLAEQKRIAAILDKADAIRRKRQQAIQLADDFLRAVFLEMFGECVTPDGYENATRFKIKELVDYIDYRGKTPEKSDSGVTLITAKNVKKGFIDEEPREYIPAENYESWMTRGLPQENDVLFTTEAPLGNVALLGKYDKVVVGQRLIALRSKGQLTHEYLMCLLLHPFIQGLIQNKSSGSTVTGIRTKELYEIELPVPDQQLQNEFTNIYWKVDSFKKKIYGSLSGTNESFSSLSQKAFSGQL